MLNHDILSQSFNTNTSRWEPNVHLTLLFGEVVGLALLDADVCWEAEAWLLGEVVGVALLANDVCLAE